MTRTKTSEQIPVFLLTGFLGAGKTTLLNRILENPAFHDTALVINEFGLVSVDHDLVREGSERPLVTTTGCICCTAGSDLRSSLDELLVGRRNGSLPAFSRVIVETTGLADPAPIINSLIPGGIAAFSLRDHVIARAFRLSGVIAAVNVEGVEAVLNTHTESVRQIAFADHAVLTRTDVAPAGEWPALLRAFNPSIQVHDANAVGFDPASLLRPGGYSAFGKGEEVEVWLAADARHADGHPGHEVRFENLNRHGSVRAIALSHDQPLELGALRQFLVKLTSTPGNGLLRIKGLVALQDDPSAPALVHAVQHRLYPITRLEGWPNGEASSRLVIIGTNLDEGAIRGEFEALSGKPQPFLAMAFQAFKRGGRPFG